LAAPEAIFEQQKKISAGFRIGGALFGVGMDGIGEKFSKTLDFSRFPW